MMFDTKTNDVEQPEQPVAASPGNDAAAEDQPPDKLPAAGLLVSSLVFLIAVVSKGEPHKHDSYWRYGISLSVIAMFFALLSMSQVMDDRSVVKNPQVSVYTNYFVFAWCFIGACVMTFGDGPFTVTSNGYFAAWGMAISAVLGLGKNATISDVRDNVSSLMGHLVASIIVVIAVSSEGFDNWKSEAVYGLVLALCSVLLVILYHFQLIKQGDDTDGGISANVTLPFFAILSLCWIVSACLMTFRGPFNLTGNGYFGVWGGAVTAIYCAVAAKRDWEIK